MPCPHRGSWRCRSIAYLAASSWWHGAEAVSSAFALPAGTGDVLVGLLALPVAHLLYARSAAAHRAAIAWNVLGLVDFTIAIGMGILTTPGPLQLVVPDVPNAELGTFPMVMIPTFAVPSSILLHALSLRQLRRQAAPPPLGRPKTPGMRRHDGEPR
jgi:hypothetical protein